MAAAFNGEVDEVDGRLALIAATRIIESMQAETRIRALAHLTKHQIADAIPIAQPIWRDESIPPTINQLN